MNSKILNEIYHGQLKPWLISFDESILKETIREVSKIPTITLQGNENRLKLLLQPFPDLLKNAKPFVSGSFHHLSFTCPLSEPNNLQQHFFKAVIDAEILRYYNATLSNQLIKDPSLDVPFQIGVKSLKGIAVLANEINNELSEKEYEPNDLTYFTLEYLKNSLLCLYFSIQSNFKAHLSDVFESVSDFYMYNMDYDTEMVELKQVVLDKNNKPVVTVIKPSEPPKLSFGCKLKTHTALQSLFDDLCVDFNFLNEDKTSVETLVELLTSTEIIPNKIKIYLGCKTTVFVFIIDSIGKHFQRLTQTNIEKSMSFYSKEEQNKPAVLITSSNFSKSRGKSKMKTETQEAILETINRYFP